ncbi:hypothetical protein IW262DRAFT_1297954 [Armillaria fumosa]|nr:hypothetical protein IW262DRAFT_1297954 [Armillaria fumosa]
MEITVKTYIFQLVETNRTLKRAAQSRNHRLLNARTSHAHHGLGCRIVSLLREDELGSTEKDKVQVLSGENQEGYVTVTSYGSQFNTGRAYVCGNSGNTELEERVNTRCARRDTPIALIGWASMPDQPVVNSMLKDIVRALDSVGEQALLKSKRAGPLLEHALFTLKPVDSFALSPSEKPTPGPELSWMITMTGDDPCQLTDTNDWWQTSYTVVSWAPLMMTTTTVKMVAPQRALQQVYQSNAEDSLHTMIHAIEFCHMGKIPEHADMMHKTLVESRETLEYAGQGLACARTKDAMIA